MLLVLFLIYTIIFWWSKDFVYFWDNILQTSIEAHKFYWGGFNPFYPTNSLPPSIHSTGYHPPLLAYITAVIWQGVAYQLWVSHFLAWLVAIMLIYHTFKIAQLLTSDKYAGWLTVLLLLEPTVVTQFTIASPDFFILAFFITALSMILRNRTLFLPLVVFFIFGLSMRGTFLGITLLVAHFLYNTNFQQIKNWRWQHLLIIRYYIPAILLLGLYYSLYLHSNGWFFKHQKPDGHYALPQNFSIILKHILDFGVRSLENGRILIWILTIFLFFKLVLGKIIFNKVQKLLFTVAILHFTVYFVLIFITQVPFSGRYFMPHFILMSFLTITFAIHHQKEIKNYILIGMVLVFELTGHFWIYPDPIAKAWDTTLAHTPFYSLRKETLLYIENQKIPYDQVSGGFCFNGNQQFIDLTSQSRFIAHNLSNKYYLYSNISNLTDDILLQIQNPNLWQIVQKFNQGSVEIILYQKVEN